MTPNDIQLRRIIKRHYADDSPYSEANRNFLIRFGYFTASKLEKGSGLFRFCGRPRKKEKEKKK